MSTSQTLTVSDAALASELHVGVTRLRRRLVYEADPANDLSTHLIAVLGVLSRQGAMTVGELAAAERVQPPSMTRKVNRLEELGYVRRSPHQTDGRAVLVEATEQGLELLRAERRRRDAWLARQLRQLTAEERDVLRVATPILQKLAEGD